MTSTYLERKPSPGGGGPQIAASRRVAAAIQEKWTPEVMTNWLLAVARGQDPDDEPDGKTGRKRGGVPPDWTTRRWAVTQLIERGYGKLKSHVVLEGEVGVNAKVQADVAVASFALDAPTMLQVLGVERLAEFRAMQKQLVAAAKRKVAELAERAGAVRAGEDLARSLAGDDENTEDAEIVSGL